MPSAISVPELNDQLPANPRNLRTHCQSIMLQNVSFSQAGQCVQTAWDHIGQKAEQLASQVANGDVADGSFVQTAVELQSLKVQASAAGKILQTLDDLAKELLTRPRK